MKSYKNSKFGSQKGTSAIMLRVSPKQHEQIKTLTEMHGYRNISDFIRAKLLESPLVEKRITEIYSLLKNNLSGEINENKSKEGTQ